MSERGARKLRGMLALVTASAWPGGVRRGAAIAIGATAAATLVMLPARDTLGVLNALLIFLLLCFAIALAAGSGPAALAAVLGFLALDLFFIPPYGTFSIAQEDHLLALFVYLGIAIVTGQLVARARARTEVAEREQRRAALLYDLNAALIGDVTLEAVLATIVERVVHVYGAQRCRILLPTGDGLIAPARFPASAPIEIDRQSAAVAEWAMANRKPASLGGGRARTLAPHGVGTESAEVKPRGMEVLFVPISSARRVIGVLEVGGRPGSGRFRLEDETLLTSFANQAALALERGRLAAEAAKAAALAESDELKSVLLAAVSHDLRTPLAVIKTSVTSLLDGSVAWSDEERLDFLQAIDEETDRLTRLVQGLLDLSRIEGGALRPNQEWSEVAEVIEDVAERLRARARESGHQLEVCVEPDLPIVAFDYLEIAQALVNLVENALNHTPSGTRVTMSARRANGAIEIAVADTGPGIPARELARIFEKFHRLDSRRAGSGIGLTIAKGFVEANGGAIWAESRSGEGATFRFTLPLPEEDGR